MVSLLETLWDRFLLPKKVTVELVFKGSKGSSLGDNYALNRPHFHGST